MAHTVTAILSHEDELAARAVKQIGDVNEARLLVGKVVQRALRQKDREDLDEALSASLRRELDALIAARRAN